MPDLKNILKSMRICRFCLTDKEPLTSIYERDTKCVKNTVPLPLQIMACVSIEVFPNDGMPQLICNICRIQTDKSYKFKAHCKRSDDALKLFLATGTLTTHDRTISEILDLDEPVRKRGISTPHQKEPIQKRIRVETVAQRESEQEKESETILPDLSKEDLEAEEGEVREEDVEQEDYGEVYYEDTEGLDQQSQQLLSPEKVPTDVFPCDKCNRSFPLKQLLDIHMNNHTRERKFACTRCDKTFFSKYDLAKHDSVHTSERPYSCVVCLKTFARATLLHRHEKIHVEVPKYLCNTCDKTFLTKDELDKHEAIHKKKRPFPCQLCDKSFAFKQGLDRHILTHDEKKAYQCNYCPDSFDTPAKLARHVTTHAGMRPYPCKLCSRTFLLSHHLTRHLRGHMGKTGPQRNQCNYKCSECTMEFKRKDGLIGHSAIHSMVSLKCIFCYKQFDDITTIREHVKTHNDGRIYPCDKCDYSFITQKHLDDHMDQHPDGDTEDEYEEMGENEMQQASGSVDNAQNIGLFTETGDEEYEDDENKDDAQKDAEESSPETPSRRPTRRASKIKNYAKFIKEELGGSDSDNGDDNADENDDDEDEEFQHKVEPKQQPAVVEETIKPINKPDGTKTYASRNVRKSQNTLQLGKKVSLPPQSILATLDSTQSIDLPIGNKPSQMVDMKIGDKIVKVQKVLMTKAEVEEMARQGKIQMKGGTMVLKQTVKKTVADPTKLPSPIIPVKLEKKVESSGPTRISDNGKDGGDSAKSGMMVRTYVKKGVATPPSRPAKTKEDGKEESVAKKEEGLVEDDQQKERSTEE